MSADSVPGGPSAWLADACFLAVSSHGGGKSKRERAGESSLMSFNVYFFFFTFYLFIYLFMAVLGLRFCARAFSSCGQVGATLHRGAGASHYRGLSCCGAQAPDAQAQ